VLIFVTCAVCTDSAYSKTNFTVLCVSYNFTVRHEMKTRRALALP